MSSYFFVLKQPKPLILNKQLNWVEITQHTVEEYCQITWIPKNYANLIYLKNNQRYLTFDLKNNNFIQQKQKQKVKYPKKKSKFLFLNYF